MTDAGTRALEALTAHAGAVSRSILDEAGPDAVAAIFAGGSLAAGSVACFGARPVEVYSDIDLYVVARDEGINAVRRAADAARELVAPAGVSFLRGLDIGVYSRGDLEAQPARPGTVGLRRHHRVFHGDAAEIAAMIAAIDAEIPPDEGLYLLENRANELPHGAGVTNAPDTPEGRLRRYLLVKTVLDAEAALEIATAGSGGSTRPEGWDRELVEAARRARGDLDTYLSTTGDQIVEPARVLDLVLEAWRHGARSVFPHASPDWATLLLHRCHTGDYKNNLREFLAMSARLGRTRLRMAWTGTGLARYSAVNALRLGAVVDAVLRLDRVDDIGYRSLDGLRAYLDRLTGLFGFGEGALRDRVAGMHRAVSGG
jgi:hypothetical protein